MKHLKSINDFLNESNLSEEFLKFQPGDCVVMKKSIKLLDFDFTKSARTWFGQKISVLNTIIRNDEYSKDRSYSEGDILFIFTEPSRLDKKNRAIITGYAGGFEGSISDTPNKYNLTPFIVNYGYDQIETQIIILSLLNGYSEVVKYDDLPDKRKQEIEADILVDRIKDCIRDSAVIYKDMEVTEYDYDKNNKYIFKGFNKDNGEKLPDLLVNPKDLYTNKVTKLNGEEITGYPF